MDVLPGVLEGEPGPAKKIWVLAYQTAIKMGWSEETARIEAWESLAEYRGERTDEEAPNAQG